MTRCGWLTVTLLAGLAACTSPSAKVTLPREFPGEPSTIRIGLREAGRLRVQQVPLEAYVQGTVLSEFAPANGEPGLVERMLEIQAVISRTYALAHLSRHAAEGFDLCTTTHCQVYEPGRLRTSRWATLAEQATASTLARVLWYNGAPAETLFHSDCGGATANAADVWGGVARPYLLGITDDGPAASAHTAWTYEVTMKDLLEALNGDTRTAVGPRLDGLTVIDRDATGRAERVAIHGTHERVVRAQQLREILTDRFGPRSIKSTWFTVRRAGTSVFFEGRGFGHGVGLCQVGALARLQAGAAVAAVLQRYFPGTSVVTLSSHTRRD